MKPCHKMYREYAVCVCVWGLGVFLCAVPTVHGVVTTFLGEIMLL